MANSSPHIFWRFNLKYNSRDIWECYDHEVMFILHHSVRGTTITVHYPHPHIYRWFLQKMECFNAMNHTSQNNTNYWRRISPLHISRVWLGTKWVAGRGSCRANSWLPRLRPDFLLSSFPHLLLRRLADGLLGSDSVMTHESYQIWSCMNA